MLQWIQREHISFLNHNSIDVHMHHPITTHNTTSTNNGPEQHNHHHSSSYRRRPNWALFPFPKPRPGSRRTWHISTTNWGPFSFCPRLPPPLPPPDSSLRSLGKTRCRSTAKIHGGTWSKRTHNTPAVRTSTRKSENIPMSRYVVYKGKKYW